MALFKTLRGKRENLPEKKTDGYAYFCIDDGTFWIDYLDNNTVQRKQINAKEAEKLTGMSISNALSSSTTEIPTSKAISDALSNYATNTSVNAKLEGKVSKAGDTMTGDLAMSNHKITGVATPAADTDAANKKYVDDAAAPTIHEHSAASITSGTLPIVRGGTGATTALEALTNLGAAPDSHTHPYLPLMGGTLTGNLTVGSSSVKTNGYIEGTWLKTTAATSKAGNFATIDGDGWIYYRTPAETLADIGAASASHNHSASNITSGTISIARGGTGAANASSALSNLGAVPKSGGTMTGPLVAQTNTSYTTAQMRNVIISTADPSGGNNGDIWLKYEA